MALSKRLRFEVFKRDGFKCCYCGQSPPAVVLEADHIDPKSRGGKDDINNLITACFACNSGKSNIPLTAIPAQVSENLEILREKEEQLREYRKFLKKIENRVRGDINKVGNVYAENCPGWQLTEKFKVVSLKKFLEFLPVETVSESLLKAISRFPEDRDAAIKYFCGICWNIIKGKGYEGKKH